MRTRLLALAPLLALVLGSTSARAQDAGPRELGTATLLADAGTCGGTLPADRCLRVRVACPGADPLTATLKVTDPRRDGGVLDGGDAGPVFLDGGPNDLPGGTLVTQIGGGGSGAYESMTFGPSILAEVLSRGWRTVQLMWDQGTNTNGQWGGSSPVYADAGGADGGFTDAGLPVDGGWRDGGWADVGTHFGGDNVPDTAIDRACLGATLLDFVRRDPSLYRYVAGQTVFAVTGQSGGSSAFAYDLAWYGAGGSVDCAVLTGGPPIGLYRQGCLGSLDPTWAAECATYTGTGGGGCGYTGGNTSAGFVDAIRNNGTGICAARAAGGAEDWTAWGLVGNAAIHDFPSTDVRFIWGDADGSEAAPLGRGYAARITTRGGAALRVITTGGSCPHAVPSCAAGYTAIIAALFGGTYNGVTFSACTALH